MTEEEPSVTTTAVVNGSSCDSPLSVARAPNLGILLDSTEPAESLQLEEREAPKSPAADLERANGISEVDAPGSVKETPLETVENHQPNEDEEAPREDTSDDGSIDETLPDSDRPIKTGVRYYKYEGFMNRMDGDDGDYVIEVLVTKGDWMRDIKAELEGRDRRQYPRKGDSHKGTQLKLPQGSKSHEEEERIQRVRIRSQTVLDALASASRFAKINANPYFEFYRPFRTLEEFHGDMKSKLTELENEYKAEGGSLSTALSNAGAAQDEAVEEDQSKPVENNESKEVSEGSKTSVKTALEHMRCYIDFVEQEVLPIRKRFQASDKTTRRRIRHDEIPYLFQTGSLAFLRLDTAGKTMHRSAVQQIGRMVSCVVSDHPDLLDERREGFEDRSSKKTTWVIHSLDFDGERLVPVCTRAEFAFFNGERDITSLECYPLAYHPNSAAILQQHKESGRLFRSYISESAKHLYYSGWTFIKGIRGEALEDEKGNLIHYPEYIESEVVLDFKEAIRNYPKWETDYGGWEPEVVPWDYAGYAEISLRIWEEYPNGRGGGRRYREQQISVLTQESEAYRPEAIKWIEKDKFLVDEATGSLKDIEWTDEDLVLLPKRLFGYVLRERRFARLDVEGIDMETQKSRVTLDDVQMPASRRKMIRSAVSAHFRSQEKEKQGLSSIQLDVIRGKGKGLVILLHGAPGVGKTATAEAVALENSKPLFPITCGDLGFSPGAVDKSLRDTFRYAHLWDCILLLDEADVFLTQRDRSGGNLERNALVGVFLRALEYYSGILFLTTNRVGSLDEAFRSRVHLSLCYPYLSLSDTLAILDSNLKRLPRIEDAKEGTSKDGYIKVIEEPIKKFIEDEYHKYSKATKKQRGPWNGRQIRNAVQIAAGLALYEKETSSNNDGLPAILTSEQFRSVAETTSEFEEYLKATKKGDEAYQARLRMDRHDDFHDEGVKEYAHYSDHSDEDETYATPQKRMYKSPAPRPSQARRQGGQRGAGASDRNRGSASPYADGASGNYPGSAKPSTRPTRPERRLQYASQEPEYGDEGAEDMEGDFYEDDEPEERGYSHNIRPVSHGRRAQFRGDSDRYSLNQDR